MVILLQKLIEVKGTTTTTTTTTTNKLSEQFQNPIGKI
jgi:hypothetical protein